MMGLKLMYITNDVQIAGIAENCGVDWIFIDLEINGKEERQGHLDTVISRHHIDDVKRIKSYCEEVLRSEPDNASLVLRQGRLLHALARHDEAQSAYARARALGLPATRILPYQAELCFTQRDFVQTRALMQELGQWSDLPRLRPVIDYWTAP